MVELLAKLLIKNREDTGNPKVREAYGSLCGILGIILNLVLFAIKYVAGSLSGSIAIIADGMNSLSDAGSSVITLLGFKMAGKKPDPEHPFGHGRMEYLSGLGVSFVILMMGFELFKSSLDKILHPTDIETGWLVMGILVVSILVKLYMSFYNYRVGKKIDSGAMKATATDSLSDVISTGVVLGCMILAHFTSIQLDGWCGLLVACLIFYAGIGAVKETIGPLLGQAPEKEFVEEIENIVMSHEGIVGIHDLVVHDYGPGRRMISLHAEVPGDGDIYETHDLVDRIELELAMKLNCETIIHMDPLNINDEKTRQKRNMVLEAVHSIDSNLSIHDFRMVDGPTHTNLVFDVLTPADFAMSDTELKTRIQEKIWESSPNHFAVMKIDKDYVRQL